MELVEKQPLLEWLANNYKGFGKLVLLNEPLTPASSAPFKNRKKLVIIFT